MITITGNYITSSFFMLLILLILWARTASAINQKSSLIRLRVLIGATAAYVFMDALFIVCSLSEGWPSWAFPLIVFVFYIIYVLLPFAWHQFVRNYVGTTFKPVTKRLELIPLIILLILVIMTPFTGALWSFAADGTYIRGPLFSFYTWLNFFYYVEPFIYALIICIRGKRKTEPFLAQSLLISLVPLAATAINNLVIPVYEIFPFQPFVSVLVALMAYFFMAAKESDKLKDEQKKTIEDALAKEQEATQKAVEASNVKSSFLSNMSHDIRTPMNAIINLTELARKEEDPAVVREYLEKMAVSEKFLLTLINDILDMSRIESGEISFNKETLTRTEFLRTVDTVIEPLTQAKNITFHTELRPGEYTILVDKMRFNQIFFNLLSNAVKFTPDGGDVWFEVNNLEAENNRLKIQFVVRDNGIGMSEEFLEHLYEPFAREHSALNSKNHGTGLGLAIVKNLVEAMDGTITVKSKLGEGTEFDVTFYVDIVAKEELHDTDDSAAEAVQEYDLAGMNILLVEDNELNTYVAKVILENVGCVVTTTENGKEAVDTFKASKPFEYDAILMDIRMPIMDGLEATKIIREMDRADATSVPIIAMTADAFDDERKRTLASGMDYHLAKPVDAQKVYEILGKCKRANNK